jgi:hypothetical protein
VIAVTIPQAIEAANGGVGSLAVAFAHLTKDMTKSAAHVALTMLQDTARYLIGAMQSPK